VTEGMAASPSLDRVAVLRALDGVLPYLESAHDEARLVGTASSLLRGIDLPVGDVDVLLKQRATVDELSALASALGGRCLSEPAWSETAWFGQYFAQFDLAGALVGFSTVEVSPTHPIQVGECIRHWPWQHFDVIEVGDHQVPVVASELRLQSEVVRSRSDRWRPIGDHLRRVGWDEGLFALALGALPVELQPVMREAVQLSVDW
jgi:hypothetical protein